MFPRGSLAVFVLVSAIAGLAFGNWRALNDNIDTAPVMPAVAAVAETPARDLAKGDQKTLTLNDFIETTVRPLFNAARRPLPPLTNDDAVKATPTPPPPSVAAPPPANLRLLGTMQSGAKHHRALIQIENSPAATWLDVGGEAGGWTLRDIGEGYVVLESAESRTTLPLHPGPMHKSTE